MSDWDGRGLPPVARARVERFAASGPRTSLLSVPDAAGAEAVGLAPVGEVMGCIVQRVSWVTGLTMMVDDQVENYVTAIRHGYATALARLRLEAEALGADGVLGIRLTTADLGESLREFVALGTAVRAETPYRPGAVFSTDLPGADVAKLMLAGWVPVTVVAGIGGRAVYDYNIRYQTNAFAGNNEVSAHTRVVTEVRAAARADFRRGLGGSDGGIVSGMSLDTWQFQETGVVGVARMVGTAVAEFGVHSRRTTLTMMPLSRRPSR